MLSLTLCMVFPTKDASFSMDEKSKSGLFFSDVAASRGQLAGYFLLHCSEVK